MLLNSLLFVVFVASKANQSFLGVKSSRSLHRLLVDVHGSLGVLSDQAFFDKVLEIVSAHIVNFLVVGVAVLRKVDLGLVAVKEGLWISFCHLTCFSRVEYVVGGR